MQTSQLSPSLSGGLVETGSAVKPADSLSDNLSQGETWLLLSALATLLGSLSLAIIP